MTANLSISLADRAPSHRRCNGVGQMRGRRLVERMDIHQSGVSRHLRILAEAGIVQMRPDGQKRLYSLRREAFEQLEAWVAGYRRHWDARLDRFGAALERNRAPAKTASREKSR